MKIIAVFKTHFDIGFTDLSENILKTLCSDMLKDVIKVCKDTSDRPDGKKYIWTMPSEPLRYLLESDYVDTEDRKTLIDLINNGQIAWHGMPFTVHTDFCGLSELIYGLGISKKLCDRFNKTCVSAKMTDVPGHSRYLPTLLSAAGIKFLHLGCNPGSTPPDVPPLFWWEGPDGSRVLTMYAKGGYGSDVIPPDDWDLPVWLAMTMTNDNIGPHTADIIDEMQKKANTLGEDTELICGTLDDFYYAVLPYLKDIPVIKKDLSDTWIHGVGTYPREVSEVRQTRETSAAVQNLFNQLLISGLPGDGDKFREDSEKIKIELLMFDEHTWGCDIKTILTDRKYEKSEFEKQAETQGVRFAEKSWNEQRARAARAEEALKQNEEILKKCVSECDSDLTVYNNASGVGDYWVPIEKGGLYADARNNSPMTSFSGLDYDELYIQISHNSEIHCFKKGFGQAAKQNNVTVSHDGGFLKIDTPYHNAVFSLEDGTLCGLCDRKTEKNWIDKETPFYRYDVFSAKDIAEYQKSYIYYPYDWIIKDLGKENYPTDFEHMTFYPAFSEYKIRENGESAEIILIFKNPRESVEKFGNSDEIRVKFTFYGYKPIIDVECEITEKPKTPYLESGHFIIPLCGGGLNFCFDKTGSIIHPESDIIRNGNTEVYCLESFVHASDGGTGIGIISRDMPLFSVGDIGILKFRSEYEEAPENKLYFNLFNNQWGTNFPQWVSGNLKFRYTLFTHKGGEETGIELASKFSGNLLALKGKIGAAEKNPFYFPDSVKMLELSSIGENRFLLILKECAGKDFEDILNFSRFKSVYRCNLFGENASQIPVRFSEHFAPWSLNCYILEV